MGPSSSDQRVRRYQRQTSLPEVGREGQLKLREAKVFVAGLGGLGSVCTTYLVAAGVGHVRIVDKDVVELENLNRQILHWTEDIGKSKIDSASDKLGRLNPDCRIETLKEEVRAENAGDLISDSSVILDATDNLETRKVLNRISVEKGVPFVFGGVEGFDGMISTFVPGRSPCLECLFPGPPPPKRTPGILGPLPGLVASIQSLEALKVILGVDGLLQGRLLYVRGASMTFKEILVDRNPDCVVCHPLRKGKGDA
jgi:adenylyltransferase/sulfurtransferase